MAKRQDALLTSAGQHFEFILGGFQNANMPVMQHEHAYILTCISCGLQCIDFARKANAR